MNSFAPIVLVHIAHVFTGTELVLEQFTPSDMAMASNGKASADEYREHAAFFAAAERPYHAAFFSCVASEIERCDSAIVSPVEVLPDLDGLCDLCVDGLRHAHV